MTRTVTRTAAPLGGDRSAVDAAVDRWQAQGLVSAELAERLRADLAAHQHPAPLPSPSRQRESLLTEALSYLGGVLVLVAAGLLTARFWPDLPFSGRVVLAAAATLLLLSAGLAVPGRLGTAGARVRSVLWTLSVAACAALLAVVAVDGWDLEGTAVGMVVTGGSGLLAAGLWWRMQAPLQLLAVGATAAGLAATTAVQLLGDDDGRSAGLAVLAVALLGGVAGLRGWLEPVGTAVVAAGAGAVVGALITTSGDDGWAHALAVAVVVGVVVTAVLLDDLALLAVGAVGALQVLPRAVDHFFPGLVAAAVALMVAGAGLITSGVVITRRRARAGPDDG
jgi:Predicted membrane protein (DUF2157)